jgi:hypothetical protein
MISLLISRLKSAAPSPISGEKLLQARRVGSRWHEGRDGTAAQRRVPERSEVRRDEEEARVQPEERETDVAATEGAPGPHGFLGYGGTP